MERVYQFPSSRISHWALARHKTKIPTRVSLLGAGIRLVARFTRARLLLNPENDTDPLDRKLLGWRLTGICSSREITILLCETSNRIS
jgi:hypothetical protein